METIELNFVTKRFLYEYRPVNRMFTTTDEIKRITESLDLNNCKHLKELRNSIVKYYTECLEIEDRNTDKYFDLILGMQSVTSVIDYYIYGY